MQSYRKKADLTAFIKHIARELGFHKVGIAPAGRPERGEYLLQWLLQGKHGLMHYMEHHLEKRLDIRKLFPEAQSVIMVAHNYYTPFKHSTSKQYAKISRYAWGKDYHKIIKKKLKRFLNALIDKEPSIEGRIFVDTAPVLEKQWAVAAGLGWQGKNTNVISKDYGSFFFLGGMVINRELLYDRPVQDFCGRCTACIEACPTKALQPYELDARRCISYLTIEYWDRPIPDEFADKMENFVFGCDICQDVCPWNRFARPTDEEGYAPLDERLLHPELEWLASLDETAFKKLFKKTPVWRAKHKNFLRNVLTVLHANRQKK